MRIDMKRARAVLERVNKFLGILIREQLVKEAPFLDEGELEDESSLADDVWEVLNSAPRQCDVGSAEEQMKRQYDTMCNTTNACPDSDWSCRQCFAQWAQTPYDAERKGENGGR